MANVQGTNGSQLWDSAFAAQAFLEVRQLSDLMYRNSMILLLSVSACRLRLRKILIFRSVLQDYMISSKSHR